MLCRKKCKNVLCRFIHLAIFESSFTVKDIPNPQKYPQIALENAFPPSWVTIMLNSDDDFHVAFRNTYLPIRMLHFDWMLCSFITYTWDLY